MMKPEDLLTEHIGQSFETFQYAAEHLNEILVHASEQLTQCLLHDGKVVLCGTGASSAIATGFVYRMQSRLNHDRPGLPAISLGHDGTLSSGIAEDSGPSDIFARQIRSLCHGPDIVIVVSASGASSGIIKAIQAAHDQGLIVIALTGHNDADIAAVLEGQDLELRVETDKQSLIHITHQLLLDCLVELIEYSIFGTEL